MVQMHLTVSEIQLLSELLLMRGEIVLGLFRLSSLIEHELNLALVSKRNLADLFPLFQQAGSIQRDGRPCLCKGQYDGTHLNPSRRGQVIVFSKESESHG